MKKEISREDERKLYEAYEVLDRLCNNKKSTLYYLVNQGILKKYYEIERFIISCVEKVYLFKDYSELSTFRTEIVDLFRKIIKE